MKTKIILFLLVTLIASIQPEPFGNEFPEFVYTTQITQVEFHGHRHITLLEGMPLEVWGCSTQEGFVRVIVWGEVGIVNAYTVNLDRQAAWICASLYNS